MIRRIKISNYFKNKVKNNKITLTEDERFEMVNSDIIDVEIYDYLYDILNNLTIELSEERKDNILNLMKKYKLGGWCWETTETAILFFNNDDYIERGYLKFDDCKHYYHSWICFGYNNIDYVFDPCLNILCKKEIFYEAFEPIIKGKVYSKNVKDYFVNYIKGNIPEEATDDIIMNLDEDVNSPVYRNGIRYKTEIENGKIKKLTAHFYLKNY